MVGGGVDSRLEPRVVGPLAEPGARREMRGRERLRVDAAVSGRADRSESVEVGSQAVGIDAKDHGRDATRSASGAKRHRAGTETSHTRISATFTLLL